MKLAKVVLKWVVVTLRYRYAISSQVGLSKWELGHISHGNSTQGRERGRKRDFCVLPTSEPLGREENVKGSE